MNVNGAPPAEAIVPAAPGGAPPAAADDRPVDVLPVMDSWVRGCLVGMALGLTGVFGVALWINPYEPDGTPRRLETHTQLGLQPCTFYKMTHMPCPSCGMTTSFALLMHGDLLNSLQANWVGTALAVFCLFLIPWGLASAYRQRTLFVRSMETTVVIVVIALLGLMMLRWGVLLALHRWAPVPR
jgi:hypothetical protein